MGCRAFSKIAYAASWELMIVRVSSRESESRGVQLRGVYRVTSIRGHSMWRWTSESRNRLMTSRSSCSSRLLATFIVSDFRGGQGSTVEMEGRPDVTASLRFRMSDSILTEARANSSSTSGGVFVNEPISRVEMLEHTFRKGIASFGAKSARRSVRMLCALWTKEVTGGLEVRAVRRERWGSPPKITLHAWRVKVISWREEKVWREARR